MRAQVVAYADPVTFSPRLDARGLALYVLLAVREVMLPAVGGLTPSAVGLPLTAERSTNAKSRIGFHSPHREQRRVASNSIQFDWSAVSREGNSHRGAILPAGTPMSLQRTETVRTDILTHERPPHKNKTPANARDSSTTVRPDARRTSAFDELRGERDRA